MTTRGHAKDPGPFIRHGYNLETRLDQLTGYLTPNALFFVRSAGTAPRLSATEYRLRIEGDAVARPLALSYEDVLRLPSRTEIAYLDCAGNWRGFFPELMGRSAPGTQWGTGGVGCAEWTGVSLAQVLELAGIRSDAVDVNLIGLDESAFSRPLPLSKALDPHTILAYRMNGVTLPVDHGFPLRAVVPGWIGSNSIKWLGRIVVSARKTWVPNNTSDYVMIGPEWPPDPETPAAGGPITLQTIKAALALPWPAELAPGRLVLRGVAHSPYGRIVQVLWRDAATEWQSALLVSPALERAWTWFEFAWQASPGNHTLAVCAIDAAGNRQPAQVPFNEKGYLLNAVLPHPVRVVPP